MAKGNAKAGKSRRGIRALGRKVTTFEGFDTFSTPDGIETVTLVSDEVTSLCPVTGQPDWYKVQVVYKPASLCIESKTMKLYLQSFRNAGLFCEQFAAKIKDDIREAIQPKFVEVWVVQKPRGGVSIKALATHDSVARYATK
jgi:7-cyano-7-deazaguanine reductase